MSMICTGAPVRRATVSAVVTRADGTKEDLGVVSYWHRNPIHRLLWRLKQWFLS